MRRAQFWILGICLCLSISASAEEKAGSANTARPAPTLEEMRMTMGKWIETQQAISRDRKAWQQTREILLGRLDPIKKEILSLSEKMVQAMATVSENDRKRNELLAEEDQLKAMTGQLRETVAKMEGDVRRLFKMAPQPIQDTEVLKKLYDRIPTDSNDTKVAVAERYQNVLAILSALNKANSEITLNVEYRDLNEGKSEVDVIYVGLSQAYYVSRKGEAGIGRPTPDGWKWEPSQTISRDVQTALEIIQGKHSPAFVPLPAKVQWKP
jgi:hypothetical protein